MLGAHLPEFKDSLGKCSEKQGERFNQGLTDFRSDTKGRYKAAMLGDYTWSLAKDCDMMYKSKSTKISHFLKIISHRFMFLKTNVTQEKIYEGSQHKNFYY